MAECRQASEVLGSDLIRRRSSVRFCLHCTGSDRRRTDRVRPPVDGCPSRCVRLVATNRAAMVARRCARHHRTGQHCGTRTAGHDRNHVPFCYRQTSRRFVRPDDGPERCPSQYPSQACLCASAPRYRHSTHSGLYTELSEWARSKFGCLLSDARLDACSDASFPLSSHSSHNDRRDPDPVGRCQPHISRSSLSERCAGGLVLRHCVGANLPDAHVVFSAYRKDRAAE